MHSIAHTIVVIATLVGCIPLQACSTMDESFSSQSVNNATASFNGLQTAISPPPPPNGSSLFATMRLGVTLSIPIPSVGPISQFSLSNTNVRFGISSTRDSGRTTR